MEVGIFNVRLIPGDRPAVAFYDSRYDHTPHGQFVSEYFVETIEKTTGGLCLDGGNRDQWTVSPDDMDTVRAFLREVSA
jgi:hypothetical protein